MAGLTPDLAERWNSPSGRELAAEIVRRLAMGASLDGLGLIRHGDRLDLRGLQAPGPTVDATVRGSNWSADRLSEPQAFRSVSLRDLDLSFAHLDHLRFHDATIENCILDGASCRDWRLWRSEVKESSFIKADLRNAAVGTWDNGRRNEWRRVDFTGADFRVAVAHGALFDQCRFTRAKLTGTHFEQCTLRGCQFGGPLKQVTFDGRPLPDRATPHDMTDVDFSQAKFDEVEFLGCKLDAVVMPADPDVAVIRHYRCVIEHAIVLLEGDSSLAARQLRAQWTNNLRMMRVDDEDYVLNQRDLKRAGTDFLKLTNAVIAQASRSC